MKPDLEHLLERSHDLREFYLAALERAMECDTPDESKCLVQEMRGITDEAKSVALEWRTIVRQRKGS
jgi:hypothetical protein